MFSRRSGRRVDVPFRARLHDDDGSITTESFVVVVVVVVALLGEMCRWIVEFHKTCRLSKRHNTNEQPREEEELHRCLTSFDWWLDLRRKLVNTRSRWFGFVTPKILRSIQQNDETDSVDKRHNIVTHLTTLSEHRRYLIDIVIHGIHRMASDRNPTCFFHHSLKLFHNCTI